MAERNAFLSPPPGPTALRAPRPDEGADVLGNIAGNDPAVIGRLAQFLLSAREPLATASMGLGGGQASGAALGPFVGHLFPGGSSRPVPIQDVHENVKAAFPALVARAARATQGYQVPVIAEAPAEPRFAGATPYRFGENISWNHLPAWALDFIKRFHPGANIRAGTYAVPVAEKVQIKPFTPLPVGVLAHEYGHISRYPEQIAASFPGERTTALLPPPRDVALARAANRRGLSGHFTPSPGYVLDEMATQGITNRMLTGGSAMRAAEARRRAEQLGIPARQNVGLIMDQINAEMSQIAGKPSFTEQEIERWQALVNLRAVIRGADPAGIESRTGYEMR